MITALIPPEKIAADEIRRLVEKNVLPKALLTITTEIHSSPFKLTREPSMQFLERPGMVRYLRTKITFYNGDEDFAAVTVEAAVDGFGETLNIFWCATEVRVRSLPGEWRTFEPVNRLYSDKWETDNSYPGGEAAFRTRVSKAINIDEL